MIAGMRAGMSDIFVATHMSPEHFASFSCAICVSKWSDMIVSIAQSDEM